MKVNIKKLISLGACSSGVDWFTSSFGNRDVKLSEILSTIDSPEYLIWGLNALNLVNKRRLVKLACISARTSLEFVPKNEKRPLKAILAAEKYFKNPSNKNRDAAWDAGDAARSAGDAARSAGAAAWSAGDSAWFAGAAAGDAAWAARAAGAAGDAAAAWSAAAAAEKERKILICKLIIKQLNVWRIK